MDGGGEFAMLLQAAKDLTLCAAFVFLLWGPLGRRILATERSRAFGYPAAVSVGMGVWGLWILLLGLCGLLYPWVVASSAALVFVALRLDRRLLGGAPAGNSPEEGQAESFRVFSDFRGWFLFFGRRALLPREDVAAAVVLGSLSAIYIGLALASSAAPEVAFDALNVHLPYARDAAAAHRVGFAPNNWSSAMPALPLMAYITGFLYSGLGLVKLINVLSYVLGGAVVFSVAREWWGRAWGIAAAALFWSCPVAVYEATTALIDLPLTLYSALAVCALLEWTRSGTGGALKLSALSLGLALGCKYHAVFWVPPLFGVLGWHLLVVRRRTPRQAAGVMLRYGALAFLLFLPWAVRAWYYTGNPVFPAANGFFQSPYFPPSMQSAAAAAYANEGVGRGLRALLELPWTVTFHPGPFRGTLGLIFLPGVALALLRGRNRETWYVLAAAVAYFLAWALTAQEIRYLLPMVPVLALLTVAGFLGTTMAASAKPFAGRLALLIVLAGGAAAALPAVYPLWAREWTYWHSYKCPWPYLTGQETAEQYVLRDVPSIYVYDYINRNLNSGQRILLLNDSAQYYSRVPTLYSFTVEADLILMDTTEEGVVARMRASGVTHVLLNYNGIAPLPGVVPRLGVYFFLDGRFRDRCMDPLYSRNNVTLYRFRCQ